MTDLEFEDNGFVIRMIRSGDNATITWTGESDSRSPSQFINPITSQLVKELQGARVTIDFSALKYINSATVAPLIGCIRALDAAGGALLVVFSDTDWQRTHVQCTRTIARTLKHVSVEVRAARQPS
jgi:anti-anti-sigma regulatory factor